MLVKRKPQERILTRDREDFIFRPFYKDKNLNPCSLCVFRDPSHLIKYKKDGCDLKYMYKSTWTGSAYDNICRQLDTPMFYYIARDRRNRNDVSKKMQDR